jgi:hypothetical protein
MDWGAHRLCIQRDCESIVPFTVELKRIALQFCINVA